ncbi:TOMM precursor leader peptide-binding protein [Nocardia sp. BMG51109]|uniref:TOMM precursor leader peptide-binding protein n=1 Tax=Nocardia sp. BMG51109 TaxID=1056816 RepID=UPI0004AE9C5B|nr:TOMM precursor leader peptide-binding protein [Nocardia sp. BMG51109]
MRLELATGARVLTEPDGVVLISEIGTCRLPDAAAVAALDAIVPLLDGSRDRAAVIAAAPPELRPHCPALLDVLERAGVVTTVGGVGWNAEDRFYRTRGLDPAAVAEKLCRARVLVVGDETWTDPAAAGLARRGVRTVGRSRNVTMPPDESFDLVLIGAAGGDLATRRAVHRICRPVGTAVLDTVIRGNEAVIGPLSRDGTEACWYCARMRLLAHTPDALRQPSGNATSGPGTPPIRPPGSAEIVAGLVVSEAAALLTGYAEPRLLGGVLVFDFATLRSDVRPVTPLPHCPECAPGRTMITRPAHGGEELLSDIRRVTDVRTGIITYLGDDAHEPGDPCFPFRARAVLAPGTAATYPGDRLETASGKGATPTEALIAAGAEALERYSSSIVASERVVRAPRGHLPGDVLDPGRLPRYPERRYGRPGFPFVPFDPDAPHGWIRGTWLDTGSSVWMPALLTYYRSPESLDHSYCQVTSSGLAAGAGYSDAVRRAVLELLERDAFIGTWLHRRPARPVPRRHIADEDTVRAVTELERLGATVECYLLHGAIDRVPTILAIGFGDGRRWPGAHVGVAAHLEPRIALRKAVFELAHTGNHLRRRMAASDIPELAAADVRTFLDHALYYVPARRAVAFDFLRDAAVAEVTRSELRARDGGLSLEDMAARLSRKGIRFALADLTAADLHAVPIRVVRALGVGLHPLHCGDGLDRHPEDCTESVNPEPHPLC